MKKNTKFLRWTYKYGLLRHLYNLACYILVSPLRLVNAIWYDIVVYAFFSFKEAFLDLFAPRKQKWARKKNFKYYFCWLFGFPYRFVVFFFSIVGRSLEGMVYTVVDLFVPTLTMMHGTSEGASINISKPGEWIVGRGDFAGAGIYFAMSKRVAKHYAYASSRIASQNSPNGANPVIIYARVSLGKNVNMSVIPPDKRALVANDGVALTRWGKGENITSFEWWRSDHNWWEYCMIASPIGVHVKTWRIRVLYIYDMKENEYLRVWGGKAFWYRLVG